MNSSHPVLKMKKIITEIIKNQEDELFLEMATIGVVKDKHRKSNYLITVDAEPTHVGNAYFKIYDRTSVSKSKNNMRISFHEPRKIIHKGDRFGDMVITKLIGKYINEFFSSTNLTNPSRTNWEESIIQYNLTNGRLITPIDFTKLTQEEINKNPKRFRNCLPIDLPMPDYTKII